MASRHYANKNMPAKDFAKKPRKYNLLLKTSKAYTPTRINIFAFCKEFLQS